MPTKRWSRTLDREKGLVSLAHGAGGRATAELIAELFVRYWHNEWLAQAEDATRLPPLPLGQVPVVSTDLHVVTPLFFPGGDIGTLAVNGTVNDLAVRGAIPLYLTIGVLLEEGFPLATLEEVVASVARAAQTANVAIVAGDTKVVERGKGDGVYLAVTGIGSAPAASEWRARQIRPGDHVIVSGTLGDHGIAIMAARQAVSLEAPVCSDCAALTPLIAAMRASGAAIRAMRDLTRGGLAAAANEIAQLAGVGFVFDEAAIPVRDAVAGACELLGIEPWHLANEGKLLVICAPESSEALLAAMRAHPLGREATLIGEVVADEHCFVQLRTPFGGLRLLDWLHADPLPRIC
ncbi:hydrogenase expression/formation protein HypE [Hydrogenophilus islandicus]